MIIVVSPYHLTTRDPAAMASLLLGEGVVTMHTGPRGVRDGTAAHAASARAPQLRRVVDAWSWTEPFWREGVLASSHAGEEASGDLAPVLTRIERDDALAPLRPLMREGLMDDPVAYLRAVNADVLKGGPDPGVSVPVSAALDRFAARHGLVSARAAPASVAQREELGLARSVFAVAVPVLLQAQGERVLQVRAMMEGPLERLRGEMARALVAGSGGSGSDSDVTGAAAQYAARFEHERDDLLGGSREDDVRAVVGTVVVQGVRLPADAVLRSSLLAAESLAPRRASRPVAAGVAPARALARACDAGEVGGIIVKALGSPGRGR